MRTHYFINRTTRGMLDPKLKGIYPRAKSEPMRTPHFTNRTKWGLVTLRRTVISGQEILQRESRISVSTVPMVRRVSATACWQPASPCPLSKARGNACPCGLGKFTGEDGLSQVIFRPSPPTPSMGPCTENLG